MNDLFSAANSVLSSDPHRVPAAAAPFDWTGWIVALGVAVIALFVIVVLARQWRGAEARAREAATSATPPPEPPTTRASDASSKKPAATLDPADLAADLIAVDDLLADGAVRLRVRRTLAKLGVRPLGAAEGDAFDPDVHAAVDRIDTDDSARDRIVADVHRDGWRLDGRVLREADVSVWMTD